MKREWDEEINIYIFEYSYLARPLLSGEIKEIALS
jgi:hypothetical protein